MKQGNGRSRDAGTGKLNASLGEAVALHRRGRLDLAEPIYRDILRKTPSQPDALHLLGLVAHQRGRQEQAIELIRRAVRVDPQNPAYANSLGLALLAEGKPGEAEAAFGRAIGLDPALAEAHNNRGNARLRGGDAPGAVEAYQHAIALRPGYAEAHANLAAALRRSGELAAAAAAVARALELRPAYAGALCTLGLIRHEQGDYLAALAAYDQALALDPKHATVRANRATLLLLLGRMEEGWREYEWRWRAEGFTTAPRNFGRLAWDGSDLAGRTLLVHAEQGLGSAIQFVRYVPLLAARGASVILECQPPLTRLFASLTGGAPAAIVRKGEALPDFTVHAPLMSLPRLLGTTLDTIPNAVPYLAAEEDLCRLWRQRLEAIARPRVGLVWAGNPNHGNDRNRSLPARMLAPLLACPDVAFVDLQVGAGAAERDLPGGAVAAPGDIADFADTAAIVAELDLVISVDTAVAHLAGALAKPVWLMLPFVGEWRWLLDRTDTPWYPTMRLFRQSSPGDWPGVVDAVGAALRTRAW